MEKIIIVNSHHSSQYHLDILKDCLNRLKKTNYKLMVCSHLPIPEEIQNVVDYCVYDSENPMLESPSSFWYANSQFRVSISNPGHSIAILRNIINGISLAQRIGFSYFFFTECDNLFHDSDLKTFDVHLSQMLKENKKMIFHKYPTESSFAYHTLLFGGDVQYFVDNFEFPTTLEQNQNFELRGYLENDFYNFFHSQEESYLIKWCPGFGGFEGFENSDPNRISGIGIICEIIPSDSEYFLYLMNNKDYVLKCEVNDTTFDLSPGTYWFTKPEEITHVVIQDKEFTLTKKFVLDEENKLKYNQRGLLEFFV